MTQRSLLQAQILEKLGAPLIVAVSAHSGNVDGVDLKQDALRTAELLGKAVQVSSALAGNIGLKDSDGDTEAVRTTLTVLSGSVVADFYQRTGKVPDDNDIAKILKSLEATLTFSDNFLASPEAVARTEQIEIPSVYVDENQKTIQIINILAPVINVISGFSFGKPENILLQEVTDRLVRYMDDMNDSGSGVDEEGEASYRDLSFLRALVAIYVQSHKEGVEKLKAAGGKGNPIQNPTEIVWQSFDTKKAILEVLIKHITPAQNQTAQNEGAAPQEASLPQREKIVPQPVTQKPEGGVSSEEASSPDSGGSPMAFFGAPKEQDSEEGGVADHA